MLYVEDALELIAKNYYTVLAHSSLHDEWSRNFIENVSMRINQGRVLSSAQSKIIIKMFTSVSSHFVSSGYITQQSVDIFVNSPSYRQTPYQSTIVRREVRYLGVNLLGFRFKYDPAIMTDLKVLITEEQYIISGQKPYFDRLNRIWIVPVISEEVLLEVREIINNHKFEVDVQTHNYLALCKCSINKPSTFVYDAESESIIGNICDNNLLAGWAKHVIKGDYI